MILHRGARILACRVETHLDACTRRTSFSGTALSHEAWTDFGITLIACRRKIAVSRVPDRTSINRRDTKIDRFKGNRALCRRPRTSEAVLPERNGPRDSGRR